MCHWNNYIGSYQVSPLLANFLYSKNKYKTFEDSWIFWFNICKTCISSKVNVQLKERVLENMIHFPHLVQNQGIDCLKQIRGLNQSIILILNLNSKYSKVENQPKGQVDMVEDIKWRFFS